jgi:preprotein translocase subunit SecG
MQTVIIVIHLMVVVALVAVVLLQRSEGGALGIGGGGGFMSARGSANVLTRTTAILATIFFVTSLGLTLMSRYGERPSSILDQIQSQTPAPGAATGGSGEGILDQLPQRQAPAGGDAAAPAPAEPAAPAVPSSQ